MPKLLHNNEVETLSDDVNPLKPWAMVISLWICIDLIYLFYTGFDAFSLIRIIFLFSFILLFFRKSIYAWHLLAISLVGSLPCYWILRLYDQLPPLKYSVNEWFLPAIWIVIVVLVIRLREKYKTYLANSKLASGLILEKGIVSKKCHPEKHKKYFKRALESLSFVLFCALILIALIIFWPEKLGKKVENFLGGFVLISMGIAVLQAIVSLIIAFLYKFGFLHDIFKRIDHD